LMRRLYRGIGYWWTIEDSLTAAKL
jgi:hypothetical protein